VLAGEAEAGVEGQRQAGEEGRGPDRRRGMAQQAAGEAPGQGRQGAIQQKLPPLANAGPMIEAPAAGTGTLAPDIVSVSVQAPLRGA